MRGEKIIRDLFDYFNSRGKPHIREGFTVEIKNNYLIYRRLSDPRSIPETAEPTIESVEDLVNLYQNNPFLGQIELYLCERGGILWKRVTEVHNNHLHLIYIFTCCT